MIEFIAKYWLQVFFGLICAGLAWLFKRYISLTKQEQKTHETELIQTITKTMDDQYKKTQEQMDACHKQLDDKMEKFMEESSKEDETIHKKIDSVRDGMLSIQGEKFKYDCQKLLTQEDDITLLQYQELMIAHNVYNNLGGNHDGDEMFKLVTLRFEKEQGQK